MSPLSLPTKRIGVSHFAGQDGRVLSQGVRIEWSAVPERVRDQIGAKIGSAVVDARNEPFGFSPGVAARCRLADGRRCFIKCVSASQNPASPEMHRREARVAAALPRALPVPELLALHDDGEWVALVFEEVAGRPPAQPWTLASLRSAFRALDEIAEAATPCPVAGLSTFAEHHQTAFAGFRALAGGRSPVDGLDDWTKRHLGRLAELEGEWEHAATGTSLLHSDVRADNLLVTDDGHVVLVDWPHACVGASWVDKVCMLPSVGLDGGPSPALVDAELRPLDGIDADAIDRVLVALTGYFTHQGAQPDPVGLPTVRAFQRAQAEISRRWLAERLNLD